MQENKTDEQYFFNDKTVQYLADFVCYFEKPCCLCAPTIGKELQKRGKEVRILDIDTRFSSLPGFRQYDIARPMWLGERFDLILCDPPFFNISLTELFNSIKNLSCYDYEQPLIISYLKRREEKLLNIFSMFHLRPSGFKPGYETVEKIEKNEIEFYTNLNTGELNQLLKNIHLL